MKLPTEGELIELENWLIYEHSPGSRSLSPVRSTISEERAFERIKLLIALARDPSQLLQDIPLDDALDRAMEIDTNRPPVGSCEPPRRTAPKLSVVVQPKKKRRYKGFYSALHEKEALALCLSSCTA